MITVAIILMVIDVAATIWLVKDAAKLKDMEDEYKDYLNDYYDNL